MQRMIEICQILLKYVTPECEPYPFFAEHDVIGFLVDPTDISEEDMKSLTELHVYYDSEYDSLVIYV